jgi:hypothetical protein
VPFRTTAKQVPDHVAAFQGEIAISLLKDEKKERGRFH